MPGASSFSPLVGYQQANSNFVADTVEAHTPGFLAWGHDSYWGGREFIYARYNGTVRQFGLCVLTPALVSGRMRYEATEVPNTANLGRTLCVAMVGGAAGNFGWFCIGGMVPVNCNANVAADTTFGIAAAGQGGANSAGKQILNGRVILPGTTTSAKANCTAAFGSRLLQVPDSDGWFIGAYLSGTGIAAGTTVVAIDPSGRFVTLSLDTTAAVAGTVTATYNNATVHYNVAHLNRPFAQGAIT